MNRQGQIAIFVILGIILVAVIFFLFLIDKKPTINRTQDFDNPESFIDDCIDTESKKSISKIMVHGGFPNSLDNVFYQGEEIAYLCKNINFYQPCVVQHPIYIQEVENELVNEISDKVAQCFSSLEQELLKRNYIIDAGPISLNVNLKPKIVHFEIDRKFSISKGGDSRSYEKFDVFVSSPLYELAIIVQEIISQEAQWCYFSNDGFMALYNDFDIRKDVLGDSTKIYTVEHKKTGEKMRFALRGCAVPNGF